MSAADRHEVPGAVEAAVQRQCITGGITCQPDTLGCPLRCHLGEQQGKPLLPGKSGSGPLRGIVRLYYARMATSRKIRRGFGSLTGADDGA